MCNTNVDTDDTKNGRYFADIDTDSFPWFNSMVEIYISIFVNFMPTRYSVIDYPHIIIGF